MAQMASVAAKTMTPISGSRRAITANTRCAAAGFTLLEILLVLTILGMASVLVVPNLGSLESKTFNAQVRGAISLLNYARRIAVVQGQPATANFYTADFDLAALPPARTNGGNWQAGSATGVRFRDSTEHEIDVEEVLVINFYPEGGSTGGTILLQQDAQIVAIDIDPFTGRVTSVVSED